MRKLLLLLLLAGMIYWMIQQPGEWRSFTSSTFGKLSKFFGGLAGGAQAGATNDAARPAAAPAVETDLPADVYCLTRPVRFASNGMSTMLPAGALVMKKGDGGNGKMLITDGAGHALVDMMILTRDPAQIALLRQGAAATIAATPADRTDSGAVTAAKELQDIDAKLASLKSELASIQKRDHEAQKSGRKVEFATSEAFVRASITRLESRRAEIIAQIPPPPKAQE